MTTTAYHSPEQVRRALTDELLKVREAGLGTPALETLVYEGALAVLAAHATTIEGSYQTGDDIPAAIAINSINDAVPKAIAAIPDEWPLPNPQVVVSDLTVRELAELLFRIDERTNAKTPARARKEAQDRTGINASSAWRETWEPRICEAIANQLMLLRAQRRSLLMDTVFEAWARDAALTTILADFYTHEFFRQAVYRLIDALQDDVLLRADGDGGDDRRRASAVRALWHYAAVTLYSFQAREENVMLWVMMAWVVPEHLYGFGGSGDLPPFDHREASYLRQALRESSNGELDAFLSRLEQSDAGQQLLTKWREWLAACRCKSGELSPDCGPHELLARLHIVGYKFALHEQAMFLRACELKGLALAGVRASSIQEREVEKYPTL